MHASMGKQDLEGSKRRTQTTKSDSTTSLRRIHRKTTTRSKSDDFHTKSKHRNLKSAHEEVPKRSKVESSSSQNRQQPPTGSVAPSCRIRPQAIEQQNAFQALESGELYKEEPLVNSEACLNASSTLQPNATAVLSISPCSTSPSYAVEEESDSASMDDMLGATGEPQPSIQDSISFLDVFVASTAPLVVKNEHCSLGDNHSFRATDVMDDCFKPVQGNIDGCRQRALAKEDLAHRTTTKKAEVDGDDRTSRQLRSKRRGLRRSASDSILMVQKSTLRETKNKKQSQRGDSSSARKAKSKSGDRSKSSSGNRTTPPLAPFSTLISSHDGVEMNKIRKKLSIRDSLIISNHAGRPLAEAPDESDLVLDAFLMSMSEHLKESCSSSIRDSVVLPLCDGDGCSRPSMRPRRSKSEHDLPDQWINSDRPSWVPTDDIVGSKPCNESRMESGLIARQRKTKVPTRWYRGDTSRGDGRNEYSGEMPNSKEKKELRRERRHRSDKKRDDKKREKQHESSGKSRQSVNAASAWQNERKLRRSVSHSTGTSSSNFIGATVLETII